MPSRLTVSVVPLSMMNDIQPKHDDKIQGWEVNGLWELDQVNSRNILPLYFDENKLIQQIIWVIKVRPYANPCGVCLKGERRRGPIQTVMWYWPWTALKARE